MSLQLDRMYINATDSASVEDGTEVPQETLYLKRLALSLRVMMTILLMLSFLFPFMMTRLCRSFKERKADEGEVYVEITAPD